MEDTRTTQAAGPIDVTATASVEAAVAYLASLTRTRRPMHIHFVNAYTISLASRDPDLAAALNTGVCFADGKPLTWLSTLRRDNPRIRQTRGPAFFAKATEALSDGTTKHYLLGGTPEVLNQLEQQLTQRRPGLTIAGSESPPFREPTPQELRARDARIRASGANVVWVGLGTPKQDWEAARISHNLPVVAVAVGAAFDFYAGSLRSAPKPIQILGLEWLHRLIAEPRRLWRRYLIGNPAFLFTAAKNFNRRPGQSEQCASH